MRHSFVVCLCKQLRAQQCVLPIGFSRYLLTACVYFMGGQMESFCPGVAWASLWAMPDLKQTAGGPSVWLGKWLLAKLSWPTVCEHRQQGVVVGTIHTDSDVWATEGWLWSFLAPATWWVEELGSSMLSLYFFSPKFADWRPGSLNHSDSVSPKGKSYSSLATIFCLYCALNRYDNGKRRLQKS